MPKSLCFPIPHDSQWIQRLLNWADYHFPFYAYFRNNAVPYPHSGFDHMFYAAKSAFSLSEANEHYQKNLLVGILSYDYKNQIEKLESNNSPLTNCTESLFFIPEIQIMIEDDRVSIIHEQAGQIFNQILEFSYSNAKNPSIEVVPLVDYPTYLSHVRSIQHHIREGDIYEMNYCMGYTFENKNYSPQIGFWDLMQNSPMPFSAFFRAHQSYLICASPERFLKKTGDRLISQPIKGTLKRGKNPREDLAFQKKLQNDEKERAENLMIVDLMRNDLSKVSLTGSVEVEELFGVYPFPKVWQMISTVGSQASPQLSLIDLIHATFPMGSMTGAPKIKCMELIECYENFKRGWFSGALGYIGKDGNLDLNVVIRSIIFDQESGKGYFAVGSAITYDADPEYEYQECLLKAEAIMEVLGNTIKEVN